jgi:alkylated DNA repair dioxygenase AlkB
MEIKNIIHIPNFIDNANCNNLFNKLIHNIDWQKINYFKRSVSRYNINNNVDEMNELLACVKSLFSRNIAGAFLNYYQDGNDYAPYHSDKYNCDTCLVSLGTSRILRYKNNETNEKTDYELTNGDLLFIPNEINNNHKHSLLKRTKINTSRISILVFFEQV